jgi:broad specificity phosphatase PhoE
VARLHLVRHGKAAAGWDTDPDPGLDDAGRSQASAMVAQLGPLGPMPIVCSPLRRTRETAQPLEAAWGVAARVDPRVAEIPSPTEDLQERTVWLQRALRGRWSELGDDYVTWRDQLLGALADLQDETAVVTHFVAINAVLGAVDDDDRMVVAAVANASITVVEHDGERFRLVSAPAEAASDVL